MAIVEELEDSPGLDYDAERQQQGDPLVSLSELLKSCPSLDGLVCLNLEPRSHMFLALTNPRRTPAKSNH